MWFATQDGLNRFDGNTFTNFTSGNATSKNAIIGSDVYDIALEENGIFLWCLTAYGGLSRLDTRTNSVVATFPLYKHPVTGARLWFKSMSLRKHSIYIGTDEGFALKFYIPTSKVTVFNTSKKADSLCHIDKIYADNIGKVWLMASGKGVLITDSVFNPIKYFSSLGLGFNDNNFQFKDFGILRNCLLIASTYGLIALDLASQSLIRDKLSAFGIPEYISGSVSHSLSTSGQDILICGSHGGLYAIDKISKKLNRIVFSRNYEDRNWLTITNSIYQSGPTIWIGSQYGVGWIRNRNTPFTGYFNSLNGNNIRIEHSTTLSNPHDTTLVVCAVDNLYFCNYTAGTINKYSIPDNYYHAFKAPGGYIIGSGESKGFQLSNKSGASKPVTSVFPELKCIQHDLLISSAQLGDSILFLASERQKGIYCWNYRKRTVTILNTNSRPAFLRSNLINRLYLDVNKRLWIIGDNEVAIFIPATNQIKHLALINPVNNSPLSINMDVCEADGRFWMATYGVGIVELNEKNSVKKIYSTKEGINNLGLYKIFKLNDSMLVSSSNNGLFVLNVRSGKVTNYTEEDGLHSNNFEETSGCESGKYIFLGGIRGFTRIEKAKFSIDTTFASLYFSSIQLFSPKGEKDITDINIREISIPNNTSRALINFSCLNYKIPEKINYQYRLKEVSDEWSSLGKERFVSLIGIPPGNYTLQIRASNEAGDFGKPITITLIYLPKWYQTWWFKVSLALVAIGIGYAIYRMRINQIMKQHKIRKDVASDLHDDIGSSLNSVKVFAHLAMADPSKKEYIQNVEENLEQATIGLRDMIWILDDKLDTVNDLCNRISQLCAKPAEAIGISVNFTIEDGLQHRKLSKPLKRNLFLIAKEAINNSVKYADCRNIWLSFRQRNKKLIMVVRDDGNGFDTAAAPGGYGLSNMQSRAEQIRFSCNICSSTAGTEITVAEL